MQPVTSYKWLWLLLGVAAVIIVICLIRRNNQRRALKDITDNLENNSPATVFDQVNNLQTFFY